MADRTFAEVLQDIVRHVQEIVRSEVRLAKVEIREEAAKSKSSAIMLSAGALTAFFAMFFLLFMMVAALALVMPAWAADLIVALVLGVAAAVMLSTGMKRFREIHAAPQRTVETIKENVEWAKQQTK
jgi:uncharacterized membrane protein YqjE